MKIKVNVAIFVICNNCGRVMLINHGDDTCPECDCKGTLSWDEDDFEEIIIREMKALAFNEDEIIECLEYDFGLDMSWHPMSVNYGK